MKLYKWLELLMNYKNFTSLNEKPGLSASLLIKYKININKVYIKR